MGARRVQGSSRNTYTYLVFYKLNVPLLASLGVGATQYLFTNIF